MNLGQYHGFQATQMHYARILADVVAATQLPDAVADERFRKLCAAYPFTAERMYKFLMAGDPDAWAYMRGEGV